LFVDVPVIIFGDHTTFLKYIDFNFVVGADGTKILQAKSGDNLKYLFYALEHNKLVPEGYKRHFSVLKTLTLPIPNKSEQQKIADFLTSLDNKIDLINKELEQSKLFKKSLLQQMFV
jgi:type I restriction enzyme, S subunit